MRTLIRCLLLSLLGLSGIARAGDPVTGMMLFNDVPDSVISCGNVLCHGPNPNDNVNGLQKAGNNGGVILTAIKSGVTQMMFLNGLLNPFQLDDIAAYLAPQPVLSDVGADFASQPVGTDSPAQTITLQNPGGVDLVVSAMSKEGLHRDDFLIGGTCGTGAVLQSTTVLQSGGTCTIEIRFHPLASGARTASLTLSYAGATTFPSTQAIALSGSASQSLVPQIALSETAIDFGEVQVGAASLARDVTVANPGTGLLSLDSLNLTGAGATDFQVAGSCTPPSTVAPGASCTFSIRFVPQDLDLRTAVLAIGHNAANAPASIALSGTGITLACTPPAPDSESRTLSCPAGQEGSIVQTRTYYCFDRAWVPDPWITVTNDCRAGRPAADLPLTEFFNTGLVHYFMTASAAEDATIDAGQAGPGWQRTAASLGRVWSAIGEAPALASVCRFYGNPALDASGRRLGPNSHFYTADPAECAAVKEDPGWIFEGVVFRVVAAAGGACPESLTGVHRLYNGRFAQNDSNHRYVTGPALVAEMVAAGWTSEGIVFCVSGP